MRRAIARRARDRGRRRALLRRARELRLAPLHARADSAGCGAHDPCASARARTQPNRRCPPRRGGTARHKGPAWRGTAPWNSKPFVVWFSHLTDWHSVCCKQPPMHSSPSFRARPSPLSPRTLLEALGLLLLIGCGDTDPQRTRATPAEDALPNYGDERIGYKGGTALSTAAAGRAGDRSAAGGAGSHPPRPRRPAGRRLHQWRRRHPESLRDRDRELHGARQQPRAVGHRRRLQRGAQQYPGAYGVHRGEARHRRISERVRLRQRVGRGQLQRPGGRAARPTRQRLPSSCSPRG